jgi:hypothetical protein
MVRGARNTAVRAAGRIAVSTHSSNAELRYRELAGFASAIRSQHMVPQGNREGAIGGVTVRKTECRYSPRWRKDAFRLCHCVFDSLHWASPDNLPSRLGLEHCGFLCERIDAFPRLCGGLLDDNEFGESGHKEGSRFLEFFVAYVGE